MKGRKALPKNVVDLRGKHGYHRPNKEPTLDEHVEPGQPDMPDFLDEEGQAEWGRLTAWLQAQNRLFECDRGIIFRYCRAWSALVMATKKINELGYVREVDGRSEQNPYAQIANKSEEQLNKMAPQLGITPAARNQMRASLPDKPKKSKEESFFD